MMPRQENIHQVDFGVKFLTACNKFIQQSNSDEAYKKKVSKKDVCLCWKKLLFKLHVEFQRQETHLKVYQN
jgi:hypothetical protein